MRLQETKSYHTAHATFKTTDDKQQQVQADLEKARKKGKRVKEHERQFEKVCPLLLIENVIDVILVVKRVIPKTLRMSFCLVLGI